MAPLCGTLSAHHSLLSKEKREKKMKKGERHKQQAAAAAATHRALKSQGFPSEPVTSHSHRTWRFSSVQLEGTEKKEKKERVCRPGQWASLLATAGLLLDSHGCIQTDLSGALWPAAASASCTPGTSCFWPRTCNKLGGEKSPQGRRGREKK